MLVPIPTLRRAGCALLVALLVPFATAAQSQPPGGFVEPTDSTTIRPQLTAQEIQGFLPARGPFSFPAPYGTQGIRLTNASDCGGADCVNYVGYSYWSNINNHRGSDRLLVFLGLSRGAGGPGPSLFEVDKASGAVTELGPLFASTDPLSHASGEGWYFSFTRPTELYFNVGARLVRLDVLTKARTTVFDAATWFGSDKYIWQAHSSADDRVHSATLRQDGTWEMLGCLVYREDTGQLSYFPKTGAFDECHVDKGGRWLVMHEDGDNRIVDLETGVERRLLDPDGGGGHHDLGYGTMVSHDNWNSLPQAVRLWELGLDPMPGPVVYHDSDWSAVSANHVAHGNARAGVAPGDQIACGSGATRAVVPRGNELVCFRLDGSLEALVVAPTMTDLDAPGGGSDYAKFPKANLDVTGEYLIWTSNMSGSRLDAFLVRVPAHLLTGGGTPPGGGGGGGEEPVVWTEVVNATATGASLQKTSGCAGCPDAGAVSQQRIESGDGYFELTASETDRLRAAGLSGGSAASDLAAIDFALSFSTARVAEVRENGVYRADTPLVPGDRFRVAVVGGAVEYSKNGVVFYTSAMAPTYPLRADAALLDIGSTITDAVIAGGGSTDGGEPPAGGGDVAWTDVVNATATGSSLEKTSGCAGCPDAGALSQRQIESGDGSFEFTASETDRLRAAGLSGGSAASDLASIDFAVSLSPPGYAEVRENGVYRADTPFVSGDRFRIAVVGGVVEYSKNGVVFYTSTVAPSYPLRADAALLDLGSTVTDAVLVP